MRAAVPLEEQNPQLQRTIRETAVISAAALGVYLLARGERTEANRRLTWVESELRALGDHPKQVEIRLALARAYTKALPTKHGVEFRRDVNPYDPALFRVLHDATNAELNSLLDAGLLHYHKGNFDEALLSFRRCLEICEKDVGREHPVLLLFLNTLADIQRRRGEFGEAEQFARRSITIAEERLGLRDSKLADALTILATVYQDKGEFATALPLFERSLEIRKIASGQDHADVAAGLNNLAILYDYLGDHDKVLQLLEESLRIKKQDPIPDPAYIANVLNHLAAVYGRNRQYSKALPAATLSVEIIEKEFGPSYPNLSDYLTTLGNVFSSAGDPTNALRTHERALEIRVGAFGATNHAVAMTLNNIGEAYQKIGDQKRSLSFYAQSKDILESVSGQDHPETISVLENLASALFQGGDLKRSVETFTDMFRRQRRFLGRQLSELQSQNGLLFLRNNHDSAMRFHSLVGIRAFANMAAAITAGAEESAIDKALMEEVQATQAAVEADPRTSTRDFRAQHRMVLTQLARLPENQVESVLPESRRRELQTQLNRLEAEMADRVILVAQTVRERNLSLVNVAHDLPLSAVLLDFVQYRRFDFTVKSNFWKEGRYAAYLTGRNSAPAPSLLKPEFIPVVVLTCLDERVEVA
jgi:tetratricopeptide (TPR) repeat protein